MNRSLPRRIGATLAHIQDLLDTIVHIGFKRAKDAGVAADGRLSNRTGISRFLRFFSEVGDSFYNRYSDIKSTKEVESDSASKEDN
jgi:hypothetical protein